MYLSLIKLIKFLQTARKVSKKMRFMQITISFSV
mgnify:CR=1 FL=1